MWSNEYQYKYKLSSACLLVFVYKITVHQNQTMTKLWLNENQKNFCYVKCEVTLFWSNVVLSRLDAVHVLYFPLPLISFELPAASNLRTAWCRLYLSNIFLWRTTKNSTQPLIQYIMLVIVITFMTHDSRFNIQHQDMPMQIKHICNSCAITITQVN